MYPFSRAIFSVEITGLNKVVACANATRSLLVCRFVTLLLALLVGVVMSRVHKLFVVLRCPVNIVVFSCVMLMLVASKWTVQPASHIVPIDRRGCDCNCGTRYVVRAAGGKLLYVRVAVCVAYIVAPSGVVMGSGVVSGVMLVTGLLCKGKKWWADAPVSGIGDSV